MRADDNSADPALPEPDPQRVVDSSLAYYHENGRITAIEPVVNLSADFGNDETLGIKLTFDSLSGSTPNGAIPSTKAQTFATPSGHNLSGVPQTYTTPSGTLGTITSPIYTTLPGQLPMDPNYQDQRLSVSSSYQKPLSRLMRVTMGGDVSYEHDFLSTSVNGALARDFNDKNTTVSVSGNAEFDLVHPIGGSPVPLSDYTLFDKVGNHSKHDLNLVFGLTQVMARRWLSSANLSVDRFSGYLNDPYKIVSVVDNVGNVTGYLYENRPNNRTRASAYWENRFGFSRTMIGVSVRYMADDWGIHSDTAQLRLRWWNSHHDQYLEPQLRWYQQTQANFYTPWLTSMTVPSTFASADERLGAFHAITWGLKYAFQYGGDADVGPSELSVRAEYYTQIADNRLPGPGVLQGLDLYPGLQAIMCQVEWKFGY